MTRRINGRAKGKAGENEVASLIRDAIGSAPYVVETNRSLQAGKRSKRSSGSDVVITHDNDQRFPVSIEVKRDKSFTIERAYEQAVANAPLGHIPVAIVRRDRRPWTVHMPAWGLLATADLPMSTMVTIPMDAWLVWLRARLEWFAEVQPGGARYPVFVPYNRPATGTEPVMCGPAFDEEGVANG